jgi:hypothetical protein
MLGISEKNIYSHKEGSINEIEGVEIHSNHLDPSANVDGIHLIVIEQTSNNRFSLDYLGALIGHMKVNKSAIDEMVDHLFEDRDPIPKWYVSEGTVNERGRPSWIPEEVNLKPRFECEACGSTVHPKSIFVIPGLYPDAERICRGCWEDA